MNLLQRIRSLPENQRKIIFWLILSIVALGLFFLFGKQFKEKLKSLQKEKIMEEFRMEELKEELKELPK
jgi:hypothetical protein